MPNGTPGFHGIQFGTTDIDDGKSHSSGWLEMLSWYCNDNIKLKKDMTGIRGENVIFSTAKMLCSVFLVFCVVTTLPGKRFDYALLHDFSSSRFTLSPESL
ncbi:hypothetical protein TNCV_1683641 [Trichonephila clavipes]|nr:hypothetical protein TNCV_1683641 [Trichonephila clavipes]